MLRSISCAASLTRLSVGSVLAATHVHGIPFNPFNIQAILGRQVLPPKIRAAFSAAGVLFPVHLDIGLVSMIAWSMLRYAETDNMLNNAKES